MGREIKLSFPKVVNPSYKHLNIRVTNMGKTKKSGMWQIFFHKTELRINISGYKYTSSNHIRMCPDPELYSWKYWMYPRYLSNENTAVKNLKYIQAKTFQVKYG